MTHGSADRNDHDVVIQHAAARLRETVPVGHDFDLRVMAAVRSTVRVGTSGRSSSPGSARFWRAGATLAAAVALVVVGLVHRRASLASRKPVAMSARNTDTGSPTSAGGVSAATSPSTLTGQTRPSTWVVRFTFVPAAAHAADRIMIVGSFNGWDTSATPLRPMGHGRWVTDVPLRPGRYVYQFVINGKQWVPDPNAPRDPGSDFGTENSVVTVPTGGVT